MTGDEIVDYILEFAGDEEDLDILLADGFEDAFSGLVQQFNKAYLACYDYDKCIIVLMHRDGMSHDEADEFMQFNVTGAWMGDRTPVFLYPMPVVEDTKVEDIKVGGTD